MPRPLYTPRSLGRTPGSHCTGGWMGPRAGSTGLEKTKWMAPTGVRTPNRPSRSLVIRQDVHLPVKNAAWPLCAHTGACNKYFRAAYMPFPIILTTMVWRTASPCPPTYLLCISQGSGITKLSPEMYFHARREIRTLRGNQQQWELRIAVV